MMGRRCAVNHSLEGGPCQNPGVVEFYGELVCERHARRFASEHKGKGVYWEGLVFHLESWLEKERGNGEWEVVRGLEQMRADAVAELYVAALDLEATEWKDRNAAYALLAALEAREEYTGERYEAVVDLSVAVGHELGLSGEHLAEVEQAALLHDIGKIGVPDSIVNKPGPLEDAEWERMKEHPVIGARLVTSVEGLSHLAPIIRAAHERWDGWGYPYGIAGEEIPLASRIVFACDAYHAMTSDRPYQKAVGTETALEELEKNAGTQFCPHTVEALLVVLRRRGAGEEATEGISRVRPSAARDIEPG